MTVSECWCGRRCDSPLECSFWHHLEKTIDGDRGCTPQVKIWGFRVDFLCEWEGKKIVVELDGAAHHDHAKDWDRDQWLLLEVDAVIRIPYAAMTYFPHGTFAILASWYSRFELRGKNVYCLALSEFIAEMNSRDENVFKSKNDWLEFVDDAYEIWIAEARFGCTGSPKSYCNQWKIRRIEHRTRETIRPREQGAFGTPAMELRP